MQCMFMGALAIVPYCEKLTDRGSEGLKDGLPPRIDNTSLVFQTLFLSDASSFCFVLFSLFSLLLETKLT